MSYASKEQLKQILQKIDDNFARKDGYYTNMAVGNAENLISPDGVLDTPENDTEYNPLLFRTTAGDKSVSDGVATANKIRGRSYKWNQLLTRAFEPNASSSISTTNNIVKVTSNGSAYYFGATHRIPITEGHKYFVQFNITEINVQNLVKIQIGNWGRLSGSYITSTGIHNDIVVAGNTSTVTYINAQCTVTTTTDDNFSFTDFMCVDLTDIYGSGNEPTTVDQFLVDYPMFLILKEVLLVLRLPIFRRLDLTPLILQQEKRSYSVEMSIKSQAHILLFRTQQEKQSPLMLMVNSLLQRMVN